MKAAIPDVVQNTEPFVIISIYRKYAGNWLVVRRHDNKVMTEGSLYSCSQQVGRWRRGNESS